MRLFSTISLACLASLPLSQPAIADHASQVQVFFDASSGQVQRQVVRIVDPEADLGLAFRWHPADTNLTPLDAEGRAQGAGRVVWRLEGLSAHDPRAWHHVYEGEMLAGRLHGKGRLTWRDGREMRGDFAHGKLHGPGLVRDAQGNITEATFNEGLAQGAGVYRARAGWVWRGGFTDGVMQGAGEMTEAGGRQYSMVMQSGRPETAPPEGLAPHPLIAGLRPAQGGTSMADRVVISVGVDPRLSAQQWAGYNSRPDGDRIFIYPEGDGMVDLWEGRYTGESRWLLQDSIPEDWAEKRAMTLIDLETTDGSRVTLDSLRLQVEASAPHLRPIVASQTHLGCVPFQPSFEFLNHGWGAVENPRLKLRFIDGDNFDFDDLQSSTAASPWHSVPIDAFDTASDVDITPALQNSGIDIARLEAARFPCVLEEIETDHWEAWERRDAALLQCRDDARRSGAFGAIADFIQRDDYGKLLTSTVQAELSYDWTDFAGVSHPATDDFFVTVSLGMLEATVSLAECGAGGAWPTEAPQFHDVALQIEGAGYQIDLPLRGNRTLDFLEYGVKLHAPRSSMHLFQVAARFSDGSMRLSPTTLVYYLHPRFPEFTSALKPAQCSLTMEDAGMC